jgi:hypothetical protein
MARPSGWQPSTHSPSVSSAVATSQALQTKALGCMSASLEACSGKPQLAPLLSCSLMSVVSPCQATSVGLKQPLCVMLIHGYCKAAYLCRVQLGARKPHLHELPSLRSWRTSALAAPAHSDLSPAGELPLSPVEQVDPPFSWPMRNTTVPGLYRHCS